jgi:hypothetical protein
MEEGKKLLILYDEFSLCLEGGEGSLDSAVGKSKT